MFVIRRFSAIYRFLILALLLSLAVTIAGCAASDQASEGNGNQEQTLRIGLKPTDSDAQVFYAQELGYFEEAGLNVEVRQLAGGAPISSGVASGSLDIGSANVTSVATAYSEGLPFAFIAPGSVYDANGPISAALAVAKDSPYRSAEDLNGKTVAVNGLNNITDVAVKAWVDNNGGDSSTLEFVEFPFPEMPAAVEQGRVDAALMLEPGLTAALESCCRVLGKAYSGIDNHFMTSGWVTTQQWAQQNPEAVNKFAEVMQKAAQWANQEQNHQRSAEILVEHLDIEEETANSMQRAVYGETLDPAMIQPQIDAAAEYGVIEEPFDATELISEVVKLQ
jgi:NitT/TauT family transport system substrate-binding protein